MKTILHATWLVAAMVMLSASSFAQSGCTYPEAANYDPAATIEDGSCQVYDCYPAGFSIDFEKADYSNANDANNQDWIMDDVRIARGNDQGLYNAFTDTGWDWADEGPENTLWKYSAWEAGDDPLNDYENWRNHHNGNAINLPGNTSTVYLVDHDLYFQIEWTSWTCCNNGGGFAYTRTLVAEASDCNLIDAIYGCTNPIADNYDPTAQLDQGCIIPGCTDPEACNYDPEATQDDGSCLDICPGCTYSQAANYDPQANEDDGSCELYDCYPNYSITFTRPDDVNGNLAENQDWITDDVRIARGNDQGLYNAFTDSGWDWDDEGPENTLWKAGEWEAGDDPLASYENWRNHHNGNAQSLPFTTSTVYLVDHDLYFHIEWLSWTCCSNGGGFSYIRTLIPEASDCTLELAVYGCTNPIADNYDPTAQLDQGCIIPGCTDPEACNYMAEATEDDGSCTNTCPGCTIEGAANYDPTANVDDGSCTVYDCFDAPYLVNFTKMDYASPYLAENQDRITDQTWITRGNQEGIYNAFTDVVYDSSEEGPENTLWKFGPWEAGDDPVLDYMTWRDHHDSDPESQVFTTSTVFLINEGLYFEIDWLSWTCCGNGGGFSYVRRFVAEAIDCNEVAAVYGCTNEIASNYDPDATLDDGTCMIDGCTDPEACNYDPIATVDDGSCTDFCPGCTWEGAPNYDPQANVDDGTCLQYTCFEGGAIYQFTKTNYAAFDAAENQDRITEDVWIARQNQQGLYNAATDNSYSDEALEGPRNTLWKLGPWQAGDDPLNDYGTWYDHHDGDPDELVGQISVLYLVDYDYYFQIEWSTWTCCGNGGGFSYTRTFLAEPSADCDVVTAIYGCNNPMALNYEPLAQANDGSCILPGCTDEEACNYDPTATLDDGSCYFADGDIGLVCPPSISVILYNGETEAEVDYAAPYVTGTCDSVIEQAPLADVPMIVENNLENITDLINQSFQFAYDGGSNQIDDGGNDMYDGGNFLGTNLGSNLLYTDGEVVMSAAFGQYGEMVTMELPGLFVLAADMNGVDFFQITGNLGADGDGLASGNVISSNDGLMRGYHKQVCAAGDPSVNHLIIIPTTAGVSHEWSADTDDDYHRLSGLSSVNRIYYLLWANNEDVCTTEDEANDIMAEFLSLVAPSSIELVDGLESGSDFPIGTTTNVWVYTDDEGNEYECSFDVSVDLVGCMDETACNYDENATIESGQCTYDDGEFGIICGDDIITYSDQLNNGAYVNYALPQVTGSCEFLAEGAELTDVQANLLDNFDEIMAVIPNSFIFAYDGGVDNISDGGNDMYDGANYLTTNFESNIDYTSGAIITSGAFGTDTDYFTEELNGLFFLGADMDNVDFFQISGNNGADGSGTANGYELMASTANYTAYYKSVCSAGDPSINHLIIVPSDVPASQTYSTNTNEDEHIVSGLNTSTKLYYALWAGTGGYCYSEEEVQDILDALINNAIAPLIYLESGQNSGTFFEIGTTTNVWAAEDDLGNVVTCETTVTVYPYWGCTDPNADNYVPNALMDDGSCFLLDCPEYEGPYSLTFTKENYADWELEENQDRINDITWITRRDNQGLYNEFDQDGYQTGEGGPSNTQWYLGQTIQQLPYTTWIDAADNNPGVNCNNDSQMALRVIDMNAYFDVTWHHFTGGNNGGGFSYTRVLNLTQSGCDALALVYGCTNMDACNYNADANVDDQSCVFPGDECDDGDPETFNDVYTEDCDCEGVVGINEIAPNTLFNVKIRDINGRVVATTQITASSLNIQHLINTDMLSNGIYLLHLTSKDGQYIVKMNVTR